MKIALDYDKTYTLDKYFWDQVIELAVEHGHEIRIVTARSPKLDRIDDRVHKWLQNSIIYCDGVAKKFVCTWFVNDYKGWVPDVWIDDKPENVHNNSTATKEILDAWRESEEYLE